MLIPAVVSISEASGTNDKFRNLLFEPQVGQIATNKVSVLLIIDAHRRRETLIPGNTTCKIART